ncbi:stalk domain-containing protein [Cohnella zeiphila]|uniref:Prolyl oligopeptidase family serine peptidase n=1 Tax=Cohnella zeiphila TaxID=2761120 RepID=A0A7X0SLF7_9BACL|nr:stalk domain-containing protein [Cohnella zeiphila]MBB6732167.1 prolyl oligopeptidase family serine peptidase [Cohnella zeiphila]
MKKIFLSVSLSISLPFALTDQAATAAIPNASPPSVAAAAPASVQSAVIPLRELCDWIGVPIRWDPVQHAILAEEGDNLVSVRLSYNHEFVVEKNGQALQANGGIELNGGTTFLSHEALKKVFGIDAVWSNGHPVIATGDAKSRANAFLTRLQQGDTDGAFSLASAGFKKGSIPEGTLAWIRQLGESPRSTRGSVRTDAVHTTVTISYRTPQMSSDIEIRLNPNGQVDDLYPNLHMTGYRAPSYDLPEFYTEQSMTVGEGDHAVEARLTLPEGKGPFPVVILVQGDGELDADSTAFAQKPFRDLAVGLAGKGVAVLRMPKTTREHFVQLSSRYTIEDEFVDNTLLAAKQLTSLPEIDSSRIYAAGHSRGGWMIPRILARDSDQLLAGAIVLAGADPSYSEIESYDHPELGGMMSVDEIAYYRKELKWVQQPNFDPSNPPKEFDLPPNPYWWADIAGYEPKEEAKLRNVPMLILQGEQDFQVPLASLQGWKEAYAGRTNVEYRTYPKLTHLFTEGTLDKGLQNYMSPENVDPQVISDMADWIDQRSH